jgi:uncharacterized membrane protein
MAETYNTNTINVSACYLKSLKVRVTESTLKQQLQEHPYYPSLYSLGIVFDRLHVATTALKLDKENFDKLQPPFIAYISGQNTGKDFVLVTAVSQSEVEFIAENKKPKKVSKEIFLNHWQKIVFLAEANEKSGEADFNLRRRKEILARNKTSALIGASVFMLAATVCFFLHSLPTDFIMNATVLVLIKIAGVAATILLLTYEIDKSNAFVKSICTAGKQTNCAAVLQSKASKVLGVSWSEAGFFYFASTFLFLLFPTVSFADKTFILAIANLVAVPYIVFSIYYQWKVVKQWCPLCLTVQAVLAAELSWSIINFWPHSWAFSFQPSAFTLLPIVYCLLIPISVWFILKPFILKAKDEPVYKAAYKRLLYNRETFGHLLHQQATAPDGYQNIGITLGNPDAENTIIKVCNPYCRPCSKAHLILDEIIYNNKNVKLKLIFTASNDKDDKRGIAARHLLAIYEKQNALQTQKALDDWYLADKKDYEAFASKYPVNGKIKQQEKQIEEMSKWCKEAQISFTPTIFINGHRLPEKYKIEELQYIL